MVHQTIVCERKTSPSNAGLLHSSHQCQVMNQRTCAHACTNSPPPRCTKATQTARARHRAAWHPWRPPSAPATACHAPRRPHSAPSHAHLAGTGASENSPPWPYISDPFCFCCFLSFLFPCRIGHGGGAGGRQGGGRAAQDDHHQLHW